MIVEPWTYERATDHDPEPTRLSVVIPAYNEARRLAEGLPKLVEVIPRRDVEVIVVDDGSSDQTLDVARHELEDLPRKVLIRLNKNSGKGAAVRTGVVQAQGHVIAYMDADMATDPHDLIRLVEALDSSQVAIGSRALEQSVVEKKSRHRTLMTRSFGMLVASTLDLPLRDTQCGFKAFHGAVAKLLFHGARVDGFAFDVEVLARAARLGLRVEEVPVRWSDVAGSKVRVVKDSLRMLLDVTQTRRSRHGEAPMHGVALPYRDPYRAAELLWAQVRPVDPVLVWDGGAVALFPCAAPTVAAVMVRRVQERLDGLPSRHVQLTFRTLTRSNLDFSKLAA